MEELCFLRSLCRDVIKQRTRSTDSVRESVKRGLEPGGRGIATVGAVTRKRLVTD
jgi:hypothetical protein